MISTAASNSNLTYLERYNFFTAQYAQKKYPEASQPFTFHRKRQVHGIFRWPTILPLSALQRRAPIPPNPPVRTHHHPSFSSKTDGSRHFHRPNPQPNPPHITRPPGWDTLTPFFAAPPENHKPDSTPTLKNKNATSVLSSLAASLLSIHCYF